MDKLKLAEWGERLRTGGAQMGRSISGKFKEILQAPTFESKMVDEATSETLEEPNWGMNMRICAMINGDEFSGTQVVKAIKRKLSGKSLVSLRLSLELLEACAMNCEKVFPEVASENVLDEMVRIIKNPETGPGNRNRAWQLVKAWGGSKDLTHLPVFRETYMSLKGENIVDSDSLPIQQNNLESYLNEELTPALDSEDNTITHNFRNLSIDQKKEYIVVTRNSLELLSSMLNAEAEPKHAKDDLTLGLLKKCKQSRPTIQMIIESTTDDEGLLFEALHLNDELQGVISRYKELHAGPAERPADELSQNSDAAEEPPGQQVQNSDAAESKTNGHVGGTNEIKEELEESRHSLEMTNDR